MESKPMNVQEMLGGIFFAFRVEYSSGKTDQQLYRDCLDELARLQEVERRALALIDKIRNK